MHELTVTVYIHCPFYILVQVLPLREASLVVGGLFNEGEHADSSVLLCILDRAYLPAVIQVRLAITLRLTKAVSTTV